MTPPPASKGLATQTSGGVILGEAIQQIAKRFESAGLPDARLEAELLTAEAVGIPRLRLAMERTKSLSLKHQLQLAQWVQERLTRKPLAYVLGEQPFMNLSLNVNPSVLIPRPETELLVEVAQKILDGRKQVTVVDVGTGSGNIALSLVQHPQVARLVAIDLSPDALALAQRNAIRNRITKPVEWILGDLLIPLIELHQKVDIVVANLPYVRNDEMSELPPEVQWEPSISLNGGNEGLSAIVRLIAQAENVLRPEGVLLLEIGADQDKQLLDMLSVRKTWNSTHVLVDYSGHSRILRLDKGALVGSSNH